MVLTGGALFLVPATPSYGAAIFMQESARTRPDKCKQADPENPSCQIMGQYTLRLNRVNAKPVAKAMDQACPSLPGCAHGWDCPDQPPDC